MSRHEWITLTTAFPRFEGHYSVNLAYIGKMHAVYLHGVFYFDNGEAIPEGIILGWKRGKMK